MSEQGQYDPVEDELDRRMRLHEAARPPDDLLARCLATIGPGPARAAVPIPRRIVGGRRARWALSVVSLAAALLIALFVFWGPHANGNVLAEVYRALDRAPAYHARARLSVPGAGAPMSQVREIWVLRGVGRREEVHEGPKLAAVIVDNLRWKLQWDMQRNQVIAWPSEMADPKKHRDPLDDDMLNRDKLLEYAEKSKATFVPEKDRLDGREVEKITLSWPEGGMAKKMILWFDPKTRRPAKCCWEGDQPGMGMEVSLDYPDPKEIPAEKLTLEVPRRALLEINDPHLGRQVYSEGQTGPELGQPR